MGGKTFVSIIVPAFNEEKYIGKCIESLVALDYPDDQYEIIVVDNFSTDQTLRIAQSFQGIVTCQVEASCPAVVRNKGAKIAKGNYLIFIDGDCTVSPDWLETLMSGFKVNYDLVGGGCVSPEDGTWVERAWANTKPIIYCGPGTALPGANLAIRKSVFEQLNGFDESLVSAEDDDLCKRALAIKASLLSDSHATVTHHGYPKTISEFSKKIWWHATSQLRAHGIFGDKVVFLSFIWLASLIVFVAQLVAHVPYAELTVLLTLSIPLAFAIKRRGDIAFKELLFVNTYLLAIVFFLCRSVGLLTESYIIIVKRKNER